MITTRPPGRTSRRTPARTLTRVLVAAVAALALLGVDASSQAFTPREKSGVLSLSSGRTTATTPPSAPAASAGGPLALGLTAFVLWRDWPYVGQVFDQVVASGSPWMRVDAGWCSLEEAGPRIISTWYQDRLDTVVSMARARNIKLLVMVGCAPPWAGGTTYHDYPNAPSQYQRVMTYLSARYAGRVAAWEIWNEPDCIGGCGNGPASEYVPILRAGFRGVRAGDPSAIVVSGGVSGNNVPWLTQMYAAGAAGYFDVLATHPYIAPTTSGPDVPPNSIYTIKAVALVHDLMVSNGDGQKKVWFTEFGWSTPGTQTDRPGVTPTKQATFLRQSADVMLAYPYVTRAFWYALRDRDDSTPYENAFGLLRLDGSPKPSAAAFTSTVSYIKSR